MSAGILIAEKNITGKIIYDSRKPRLQVAVNRDPKHLDSFIVSPAPLVTSAGNGFYLENIILSINHNLGYKPRVLMYTKALNTNVYRCGFYFFSFGAFDDSIIYRVTDKTLTIVQILDDSTFNVGVASSASTVGNLRIKYMLFSNPVNNATPENKRV